MPLYESETGMTATFSRVQKTVMERWEAHWAKRTPTAFENLPFRPTAGAWVRLSVQSRDARIQGYVIGQPRIRLRVGAVYVQLFTPRCLGLSGPAEYLKQAVAAFSNVRLPGRLTFGESAIEDVGLDDPWHRTAIATTFRYFDRS